MVGHDLIEDGVQHRHAAEGAAVDDVDISLPAGAARPAGAACATAVEEEKLCVRAAAGAAVLARPPRPAMATVADQPTAGAAGLPCARRPIGTVTK